MRAGSPTTLSSTLKNLPVRISHTIECKSSILITLNIFNIDKKTLVFDLDETLVRVQKEEPKMLYDTRINVVDHASNHSYFVSAAVNFLINSICGKYIHHGS